MTSVGKSLAVWNQHQVRDWFNGFVSSNAFTFSVSYRGLWWPFCRHYLHELAKLHKQISGSGGKVLAWTSQSQDEAEKAREEWKLPFVEVIGDPENKFARMMKENGFNNPIVTGNEGDEGYDSGRLLDFANKQGYFHGMVQPCTYIRLSLLL